MMKTARVLSKSFKKMTAVAALTAAALGLSSGNAFALTLPNVHSCGYGGANANLMCWSPAADPSVNIYVASQHDSFISYSANALNQLSGYYSELSSWGNLPAFGSGQITKLFTFNNSNNGAMPPATGGTGDNHNPSPSGDQTPKNDGLYVGDWPFSGVVTIAGLKTLLSGGSTSPVFAFDFNNGDTNLGVTGYFSVTHNGVVKRYTFDNGFGLLGDPAGDGVYNPDKTVGVISTVTVQWVDASKCPAPTFVCTMNVNNDIGSGKPDFFVYTPSFNVNDWSDTDTLGFHLEMTGLRSGGEELALGLADAPTNVPEPNVLALTGLSLLVLGGMRRRNIGRAA